MKLIKPVLAILLLIASALAATVPPFAESWQLYSGKLWAAMPGLYNGQQLAAALSGADTGAGVPEPMSVGLLGGGLLLMALLRRRRASRR